MAGSGWRHAEPNGWRLVRGEPVTGDEAARLVLESVAAVRCEIWFQRPADRSLSIISNGRRAMLILWGRDGYDEGVAAVDPQAGGGEQSGYLLANGQDDTYPDNDNRTVPLEQAVEAVRHVIDHDTPDRRLTWEAW